MSFDIVSKFLTVSGEECTAQNDNNAAVEFSADEKAYIQRLTQKYGLTSRAYVERDGERIDVFMNTMERQYNLPTLCLTKHPESNGQPGYRTIAAGDYGFVVPSNNFAPMQTVLSKILMTGFQKLRLRSLET